jgi:hypothetical protein
LRRAEFAKRAATAKPVKWRYDSDGTTAQSAAIDVKTFHCSACQALVFFENTRCLNCGRSLAFAADRMSMVTLNPGNDGVWLPVNNAPQNIDAYRLCANYTNYGVCNWAIPNDSAESLCRSCGVTRVIPNLDNPASRAAWAKLETAKRRLVYAILGLGLPLVSKVLDAERGLEFQFLSDSVTVSGDRSRVLTGHDDGLITINVAEADDVYRETQRQHQHEPYRTLLGHFRHEIGHYYWDRLIADSDRLARFRELFGDEQLDYAAALKQHYEHGAPLHWEDHFVSAYATTHPWEDWAESWAHVMHMVDALETAHAVGLSVNPVRRDEPALTIPSKPLPARIEDFDQLIAEWLSLTYVLNNLTRGLGLADAYPFVLSAPVIEKLRFVCHSMTP